MTLGKRLSTFRKIAGLTQQQLSENLSLSPQAISKWENDLSEPDIATLRALANLYNVSLGELVNLEGGFPDPFEESEESSSDDSLSDDPSTMRIRVGSNGGSVNERSGSTTTTYSDDFASKVVDEIENRERKKQDEQTKRKNAFENAENSKRIVWSIVISSIVAVILIAGLVSFLATDFNITKLLSGTAIVYALVAFTFILFYDVWVKDVFLWFTGRVISWPGLIFEWSIDGFIWLIGMKLMFAIIGFLFGVLMFFIGLFVSSIFSMFYFPWLVFKLCRDTSAGVVIDY